MLPLFLRVSASAVADRIMGRPKAAGQEGTKRREEMERYEDQAPEQAVTFMQHDFGLDRRLIKAVAKMGFVYPTLVQSKCIPLALKGKDLLVSFSVKFGSFLPFARRMRVMFCTVRAGGNCAPPPATKMLRDPFVWPRGRLCDGRYSLILKDS